MLLSEILGKKVVALSSARALGVVDGAYIDTSTYKAKYISMQGDMRIFPVDAIYAHRDILTVGDINEGAYDKDAELNTFIFRIGVEIYDVNGNYYGVSTDIDLSSKRKAPCFLTDNKAVKSRYVVAASDDIILINTALKPLLPYPVESSAELIESNMNRPENGEERLPIPREQTADYSFLLGRRLNREVADISRSFVLMAGTLITERVIANARKAGKIADLVTKSE